MESKKCIFLQNDTRIIIIDYIELRKIFTILFAWCHFMIDSKNAEVTSDITISYTLIKNNKDKIRMYDNSPPHIKMMRDSDLFAETYNTHLRQEFYEFYQFIHSSIIELRKLKKSLISMVHIPRYIKHKQPLDEVQCSICLDNITTMHKDNTNLIIECSSTRHYLHMLCAYEWYNKCTTINKPCMTCPMCRTDFSSKYIIYRT
jgi:hypothetical protein